MQPIHPDFFPFFRALSRNNRREWFQERKARFDSLQDQLKSFLEDLRGEMEKTDLIESAKVFRIYRDVRFSTDKSPYKSHMGMELKRATALRRGGYYLHLEPGGSFAGGGFWAPEPQDIKRIRDEFAMDAAPVRAILADRTFKKYFGSLEGEALKTAPAGYDRDHPDIDLIRMKQWVMRRPFSDEEVMKPGFGREVVKTFVAMRPFFDYMSEVLTTDLNGERIVS